MMGRHSGQARGRGPRQPLNQRGNREPVIEQNHELGTDLNTQVATAIQHMIDLLVQIVDRQDQNPVNQSSNPRNYVEGKDRVLERFQKFSLSKFLGGPDPDIAERLLKKMIDIFAALHYTEDRQVAFADFQLERVACSWWNVIRTKWKREQTPRTWVNFIREYNAKYFSSLIQEKRENEFIKLRQVIQTIVEFETQFTRLSKFAPDLVVTE